MPRGRRSLSTLVERDPTKDVPEQERIGQSRQKMTLADRLSLEHQIEEGEASLNHGLKGTPVDAKAKKDIEKKKMLLAHDEDLVARGSEKDQLDRREKELRDMLVRSMPTKTEMWRKTGSNESQQAIRHNVEFQRKYDRECKEWQNIRCRQEPDNPYAQSLENIRPD